MAVSLERGVAEQYPVDDAGMYQFVGKDEGLLIGQSRQYSGIGMITAVEKQGGFPVEAFGHQLFQFRIYRKIPGQQAGRRGGERITFFLPFFKESFPQIRAGRQSQVIVRREVKHNLPVSFYPVTSVDDVRQATQVPRFI